MKVLQEICFKSTEKRELGYNKIRCQRNETNNIGGRSLNAKNTILRQHEA